MVVRKRSTKAPRNPYLTAATPDELGPADRIAYDIIAERRDLLPSVERIMNAGLDADGTVGVLNLFRCSLTAAGDPNRDPRSGDRPLLDGVGKRGRDNRRGVTLVAEPLAAAPGHGSFHRSGVRRPRRGDGPRGQLDVPNKEDHWVRSRSRARQRGRPSARV